MHPNVVFITAHDIGRQLGCYGVSEAASTHLDRLSEQGVRFSRFFSTAPQCSPSRASYMTGRYPHCTGVIGICSPAFGFDLRPSERHLAHYLKGVGYRTEGVGEVHETLHAERLFDHYFPASGGGVVAGDTDAVVKAARGAILDAPDPQRPLYVQIGFREAHRPFREVGEGVDRPSVPPWLDDEPSARDEMARFRGSIQRLDDSVAEILDAVEKSGRAADTIVVFLADHGIPFPRAKHSLYEAGCEAAAIFRWPARGWSGGRVIDRLVSGIDVLPTLLDAVGINASPDVQGRSLCPMLDGRGTGGRGEIFTEQNYHVYLDASRAIRTDRFKLIANFSPGRSFFDSSQSWRPATRVSFVEDPARALHPAVELYDLLEDPLERTNLWGDSACGTIGRQLADRLMAWMRETGDPLLSGLPEPPSRERTLSLLTSHHEEY